MGLSTTKIVHTDEEVVRDELFMRSISSLKAINKYDKFSNKIDEVFEDQFVAQKSEHGQALNKTDMDFTPMDLQSFSTKPLTQRSENKAQRKKSAYITQGSIRKYHNIFDQSDQEKKSFRSDTRSLRNLHQAQNKKKQQRKIRMDLELEQEINEIITLLKTDFTTSRALNSSGSLQYQLWNYNAFQGSSKEFESVPYMPGSWSEQRLNTSEKGLLLKQLIVKTKHRVNFNVHGIRTHIKARLYGNTTLWFFSRVQQGKDLEEQLPIVIIRKQANSRATYGVFGTIVRSEVESGEIFNAHYKKEFKYYKSIQIPEFYYDADSDSYRSQPPLRQTIDDYVDVNFCIVDNGDDQLALEFQIDRQKFFVTSCEMQIQQVDRGHIMLAGAGDNIWTREVMVKAVPKRKQFSTGILRLDSKTLYECCCSIF